MNNETFKNSDPLIPFTGALVWLMLCAIPPPALADETQGKPWSDEAELSFISTGGNSDVETLSAKNLYKLKFAESYTFIWKLEALHGKTNDTLSAERYFTDLRLEYAFSERAYSYTSTSWLQDTFAGLDSRVNFSVGGGYRFLVGPESFFKLEAGVNNVKESYTTEEPDRRFMEGRLYGEYIYHFSEKNKFSQSIESLHDFSDSDRYRLNSETALTAALNDRFSLKISYQIKYNHQPVPATLDKSDTILSTAIVANF
jgi:putative salt-induced outer membrane protein